MLKNAAKKKLRISLSSLNNNEDIMKWENKKLEKYARKDEARGN